ncbi:MAG: hypothetical protein ACYC33_03505 [Thermoleophilia bacterium]
MTTLVCGRDHIEASRPPGRPGSPSHYVTLLVPLKGMQFLPGTHYLLTLGKSSARKASPRASFSAAG